MLETFDLSVPFFANLPVFVRLPLACEVNMTVLHLPQSRHTFSCVCLWWCSFSFFFLLNRRSIGLGCLPRPFKELAVLQERDWLAAGPGPLAISGGGNLGLSRRVLAECSLFRPRPEHEDLFSPAIVDVSSVKDIYVSFCTLVLINRRNGPRYQRVLALCAFKKKKKI